jgi:hypothetical protein
MSSASAKTSVSQFGATSANCTDTSAVPAYLMKDVPIALVPTTPLQSAALTNALAASPAVPAPTTQAHLASAQPSRKNALPSTLATLKTPCHFSPRANVGPGHALPLNSLSPRLNCNPYSSLHNSPNLNPSPTPKRSRTLTHNLNLSLNLTLNPSLDALRTLDGNRHPHAINRPPSWGPPPIPTPPQNVVTPHALPPPPNE